MAPTPIVEPRNGEALLAALCDNAPGYVPEWAPAGDGAGHALLAIAARYLEIQGEGLNRMPERLRLAFLDSLGNGLLPARAAHAALVFKLMDQAPLDVDLPAGTRVAAQLPPLPPSLAEGATAERTESPQFQTEETIRLMRGTLGVVYTVDPQSDTYAEHTPGLATGFTLFDGMGPVPHELYLGHDEFFRLAGTAEITLSFDFWPAHEQKPYRPLLVDWEYLSQDGWLPLELAEDSTKRMTQDGKLLLRKSCGPDSKEDTVAGHKSYWLRGRVSPRLPSAVVSLLQAGYWLELEGSVALEPGGRVTVDGLSLAALVAWENQTLVLDRELVGANTGVMLKKEDGTPLAKIKRRYLGWRVGVEDARELLPDDRVTLDGHTAGTVTDLESRSLTVAPPLGGVQPGSRITLADALPPLSPEGSGNEGLLPTIDVIRVRVGFTKANLLPESAYADGARLDTANHFHPFGRQPAPYATFYLASREVFQRRNAQVVLAVTLAQAGATSGEPCIRAEYRRDDGWAPLLTELHEYRDATAGFTAPLSDETLQTGTIGFVCPGDWIEAEVNGERNYWLRFRIDSGDYGQPLQIAVEPDGSGGYKVVSQPATLQPPVIANLRLQYTYSTDPALPGHCITYNDFAFRDHSEDARWPRRPFQPFEPVADRDPALHLGFTGRPPAGLVSLYAQVSRRAAAEAALLPFVWEYRSERGWTELSVLDETGGLRGSGTLQFVGAPDAVAADGLGRPLYRIRARLKPGYRVTDHRLPVDGLWLNAVPASQGERVDRELLGISNGNSDQTFTLSPLRVPVLPGEVLEVREWSGRGDDWQTAVQGVPAQDLRLERDPRDLTTPTAVWVRWQARPHLYASGAGDRHYTIDHATGTMRFGGEGYGAIPPAGARIVMSFATGGGLAGNVPAGTMRELRSGVGYVETVFNPLAASGGAAMESVAAGRERATRRLRHRDRAVSAEDYEWLAREASPEVVRVRCLPAEGPAGRGERGRVRLILIPQSSEARPAPSLALTESVLAYLRARAPAGIGGGLQIDPPDYVRVGIRADVVPLRAEEAAVVEARVRQRLAAYLHPLSGGPDGTGWDFGVPVDLSAVASLLESTAGVNYVPFLQLQADGAVYADQVPVGSDALVAAGDHQLKILLGDSTHASA